MPLAPWLLLKEPTDPVSRAASALVGRAHEPPVKIRQVAEEYAEVRTVAWDYDCDAITVGLGTAQMVVFLRAGLPRLRERFTLAHELGHLVLGWHIGTVGCAPQRFARGLGQESHESHPGGPVLSQPAFVDLEKEATTFAGHVLLPRPYVEGLAQYEDMDRLLEGVSAAELSAQAGILSLCRHLAPGFVFRVQVGQGDAMWANSPSTSVPYRDGEPDPQALSRRAYDHGETSVSGRRVRWYRLVDVQRLPGLRPGKTSKELLADALATVDISEPERARLYSSVQGAAAGLLSNSDRRTREQSLALLRLRLGNRSDLASADADGLDAYYVAKVTERFANSD